MVNYLVFRVRNRWDRIARSYIVNAAYVLFKTSLNSPVLYALHVFTAVALLLQSLSIVGSLLDVGQHISHQSLLQPFPHAVHQLLLFPTHEHNRKRLQLAVTAAC